MSKITDKDVFAATANGDGTYNGFKLAQWLYEATTGKPLSDEDAKKLVAEAQEKAKARRDVRSPGS
ncbi:MAG: hypothetical protein J0J10_00975 [Bosea sp.]|uniref:hypothetical protein n=1 Tax=Bosea sp. (in: a-proteobacteria) TaxID=1871050 RepID=UPI001AC8B13E|nr:hypothetical protein [Bosea sp. (in: a-proteobacteria)]MBN9467319.1 hypothetical protein [Bosea sp. (in: a-proteobacteria)]